jgi:hypothetical protein
MIERAYGARPGAHEPSARRFGGDTASGEAERLVLGVMVRSS